MLKQIGPLAAALSLLIAQASPVWATESTHESTMTVTATRTEHRAGDVPVSVSLIGPEEIKASTATTLGELLQDIPGVELTDDSLAGMQRLVIRGESGARTLTLVDGQKISEQKSMSGAPLLMDINSIERVEVIKGPASVLYGSEAIGGVVNMITKKGGDRPLSLSLSSAWTSATNGWNNNLALFGSKGAWDYRISGSIADHGDRETPSETLDNSDYDIKSGNGYLGWNGDRLGMGLTLETYNADINSHTPEKAIEPPMTDFHLDLPEWSRKKAGFFVESRNLTGMVKKVRADVFTQKSFKDFANAMDIHVDMRPPMAMDGEIRIHTENDQETQGGLLQVDLSPYKNHLVIAGADLSRESLDADESIRVKNTFTGMGPMPIIKESTEQNHYEASLDTLALFAQDEWLMGPFTLTTGLRHTWTDSELDETTATVSDRSDKSSKTIGSIGLVWRAAPPLSFRTSVSQGYRTASLQQLYIGTSHGSDKSVLPNADLKAETSDNLEVGMHYETRGIVADLALFASRAENYITTTDVNPTTLTYNNMDEAETFGGELTLSAPLGSSGITPHLSGTVLRRTFETDTYKTRDTGSPRLSGKAGVRYDNEVPLLPGFHADLFMRAASEAKDYDPDKDTTETLAGWATLNLSTGLRFGKEEQFRTSLELTNLLDKAYTPSHSTLEAPGRAVAVKLSATF
ncbi:TonB-dependent receptor [Desulfoluna sp.]|uniref:TonB-dependent receptor n=1 Tax=Desulfoluna sp. TaxID=2045199 RepID=UPI00260427B7|nr:TonB-dependent receptor [Desulfoluna sp.]